MDNPIGFEEKKEFISDFNEAKFQILRLHLLWQTCNLLSQAGELTKWQWKLDTAWRELSSDAREKDGYKNDEFNKWITEGKKKKGTYIHTLTQINKDIASATSKDDKYVILQQKEMFLRALQDAVGKGSKKRASDEDDIDE